MSQVATTKVAKTKENLKLCQCMKCPTYTFMCKMKNMPGLMVDMMSDIGKKEHMEAMYCAFDKSKCIDEEKGCICMTCALYKKYNLDRARPINIASAAGGTANPC
ncbi:MAG: DUF2769 domain-containing protein [Chloroflexi bacterium]|nr:DUF2769 domain-containing protein [Chloroflexota bacterium]